MVSVALTLLASAGAVSEVRAAFVEILPTSYTFDKATDTGSYSYHDWTGVQLIDGSYGTNDWGADLGHGNAYEWVGWVNDSPVNIDFDFGSPVLLNEIHVGTVQDNLTDVVLPSVDLYSSNNGSVWNQFGSFYVPESIANDNQHFIYQVDGLSVSSRYVRVTLLHSYDGPWTFTDEIDFYRDTSLPSPEPSVFLLFGTGLSVLALKRNRKERNRVGLLSL
jgi:hypothetical protein